MYLLYNLIKQITRPSFFSEAAGALFRACVVVGCALRLQPHAAGDSQRSSNSGQNSDQHAAGDSQRSSNSGQNSDQRLDNDFPNCFLVHLL